MTPPSKPIVVEARFEASPEAVWRALTEREQMVEWFFEEIPEFKAEAGFQTQFDIDTGEQNFRHLWTITEVVPQQRIVYDWRYEEFPGVGKVTFELITEVEGARLRVTTEGVESFPQEIPEFSPESCRTGWEYFIHENLRDYLDEQQDAP